MTKEKKPQKSPRTQGDPKKKRRTGLMILLSVLVVAVVIGLVMFVPFGKYDFSAAPTTTISSDGLFNYKLPLDPESPWAKFRANELQNGRSPIEPVVNDLSPWSYRTGKGIFSSPVVDGEGNVYIGSADTYFYRFNPDGSVRWALKTGEIIDSSALLDNQGFVYFGSGDANVYKVDRETGKVIWKSPAHSVEEVEAEFGIKTFNVNWFEGNIGILQDGTLLAPNDNYLVYSLDRETGEKGTIFPANEMVWSLPSLNLETGRIFFASCSQILQNVFGYDLDGNRQWLTGSFGTVAATTMLTNTSEKGAVLVGGFDGFLRAFAQDSGKLLWKFGTKDHIYASPAQLSDGTIIQPSSDGTLYAINPETGKAIWEFDTLEPIRSSPAVDGNNNIYFGNGEGKLYSINPDGTLRWSYQLVMDDRNDLNSSPALGHNGVYIAGESGEVFFVPYDYPLTTAGKSDMRSYTDGENMPSDGAHFIYTTSFGALLLTPDKAINANEPITLSLSVRENGDNLLAALDRKSVSVVSPNNPNIRVEVGATNKFINIVPVETWTPGTDGNISITISSVYKTRLQRFGLKFFGGTKTGAVEESFTFKVIKPSGSSNPFITAVDNNSQSVIEFSRLSVPTPSMLPSYNQIGFDSLHYVGGAVTKNQSGQIIMWVIEGRLDENGQAKIDPSAITRYPILLHYEDGLVTLANYEGFKIKFIGSWDMPFASYRISTAINQNGEFQDNATVVAVTNCDEIEFYGIGLKLVGMSEFKTGQMFVRGGTNVTAWDNAIRPDGIGEVTITQNENKITAEFSGSTLRADEHVYSIMLADENGNPLPLYYTNNTSIEENIDGTIKSVTLTFDKGEDITVAKTIYVLADTYPVFVR
jgi:outer membrane protein assembly factor BamB